MVVGTWREVHTVNEGGQDHFVAGWESGVHRFVEFCPHGAVSPPQDVRVD